MRAEWSIVEALIQAHIAASNKKWKAYEASQLAYTARLAMLTAFVEGKSPADCAAAARERIEQ
ncbi:hypothetical protein RFN29_15085 [Mesorhizobium sp. VK22B]|uniref:Uncharacterized protein n=1 Tax=Mesorhizobium captivum TaxID=3072319 RepID=A0ABU4Z109_9HYPH|nr:hypothetical protein [Mesorhizobium sp. VK22B]MDX8492901.1 hypothetical protein [Mesorhizobium sp. VK22B]